jgi:peptidoglycan/LPS O-acetylase OafA/YrhL
MPRWASSLGKISYGLYVWHLFMLVVARGFISSRAGSVPLALGFTILTARLSYALIERPFLRLKRRFEVLHSRAA